MLVVSTKSLQTLSIYIKTFEITADENIQHAVDQSKFVRKSWCDLTQNKFKLSHKKCQIRSEADPLLKNEDIYSEITMSWI